MFIPFTAGFLVDPQESRAQIERLLELLPNLAEQGREGGRVAAGSAVVGALAGLVSECSHKLGQYSQRSLNYLCRSTPEARSISFSLP